MEEIFNMIIQYKSIPYTKSFKENLYKYFQMNNYSVASLDEVAKRTRIKTSILKTYIYSYVKEELNMTREEFNEFRKQQRIQNNDKYIGVENFILKEMGVETKFLWATQKEKEYFLKKIYEYSSKRNFSMKSTKEMAEKLNIEEERYIALLEEARDKYFKNDENDYKELAEEQRACQVRLKNIRLRTVYEGIINAKDMDEIDKIVNDSGYEFSYIRHNADLYNRLYSDEENAIIEESLKLYAKERSKKLSQLRKEKNELKRIQKLEVLKKVATKTITKYLEESNKPFEAFLNDQGIDKETFNKYLECVKNYNKELYDKYLESKEQKNNEDLTETYKQTALVGEGLEYGYNEEAGHRKFDVIDYFLITHIPISKVLKLSGNLKPQQRTQLKRFTLNYAKADIYKPREEEELRNTRIVVGVKFDSFGKEIPNSGKEITKEEINKMFDFLKENDIPINAITFNAVKNRYLRGFLTFEEDAKKLTLNDN